MNVVDLIKRHEGSVVNESRHIVYKCSAKVSTVAYGRNLEDRGLSEEEALFLLNNDVQDCVRQLQSLPFWLKLSEVRRAVLIDMCFNLGFSGLCNFRRMFAAIEREDWERAGMEMQDSKWWSDVGSRAERLFFMMTRNEWPTL